VRRPVSMLVVLGLSAVSVACGEGPPAAYTDRIRADLLAACTAEDDPPIVGDICACTYRHLRVSLPFERFREIDEELRLDPFAPLPDDVLTVLAECVIEVGDL
jgi:hypothetical protein